MTYQITSEDLYETARLVESGKEFFLCFALYCALAGKVEPHTVRLEAAEDFVEANRPATVQFHASSDGTPGIAWDVDREFKINWALQQAARLKALEAAQ